MKLRECTLGDILYVCCHLRDDEWDQVVKFGGARDIDSLVVANYLAQGPKWAYVDDDADADRALVVGGYTPLRPGVYRSWFLASAQAWGMYARPVTEMAAERTQFMLDSGAHRLETVCLASRKLAQRWYKAIGLQFESTLKGFCVDGSDAVVYVATRGGT